jgi:hypothetical protein
MQGQGCQRSTSTRIPGIGRKCRPSVAVTALWPMDFAGWFEAFLDGRWYTFDPRNNMPRKAACKSRWGVMLLTCLSCTHRSQYACQLQGVDGRGQLVLSTHPGRTSSGFYGLQGGGLGDPQPKNLLGLIDAAQLKLSE